MSTEGLVEEFLARGGTITRGITVPRGHISQIWNSHEDNNALTRLGHSATHDDEVDYYLSGMRHSPKQIDKRDFLWEHSLAFQPD